jgi:3-oxoacyl-[acyl-carrier protein] reductase
MDALPVTLITGARKGIGRALCEHYLSRQHLVIGCSRSATSLVHDHYQHVMLDVADEAAVTALFAQINKRYGRLDHLINNAGIASLNSVLLTPLATWEEIFRTNVTGTFLFCRAAARQMIKRKYGRIVNFSSVAVPLSLEGEAAYAASKAAVESLTKILAKEFAPFGITVNALGPNPVATDLTRSIPEEKLQSLLARQAIARRGEMSDVTNVTDFFMSPQSDFITGQTLFLGGIIG